MFFQLARQLSHTVALTHYSRLSRDPAGIVPGLLRTLFGSPLGKPEHSRGEPEQSPNNLHLNWPANPGEYRRNPE